MLKTLVPSASLVVLICGLSVTAQPRVLETKYDYLNIGRALEGLRTEREELMKRFDARIRPLQLQIRDLERERQVALEPIERQEKSLRREARMRDPAGFGRDGAPGLGRDGEAKLDVIINQLREMNQRLTAVEGRIAVLEKK